MSFKFLILMVLGKGRGILLSKINGNVPKLSFLQMSDPGKVFSEKDSGNEKKFLTPLLV